MSCHGNDLVLGGPCSKCGQPRHPGSCVPVVDTAALRMLIEKADGALRCAMREPEAGYPPGTWIRWMVSGRCVIGVVQYVRESKAWSYGRFEYITDNGATYSDHILEAR